MKKIKIFPAPHVEIRIHVTEEMEKDMRECKNHMVCKRGCMCSWYYMGFGKIRLCELPEVQRQVLGGAE